MAIALDGSEDTVRAAVESLAGTIDAGPEEDHSDVEEFITELTDFALELFSAWPVTAPSIEIRGLLTLLKRARSAHAQGDEENFDLALAGMRTVLARIRHQLTLTRVEDSQGALELLDESLDGWSAEDVARVVGAQPRVLSNWRSGTTPRKAALERLQLVAELVVELRTAMTPRGIRMWFDNPVPQLGGKSPIEVLDESEPHDPSALVEFARGGLR